MTNATNVQEMLGLRDARSNCLSADARPRRLPVLADTFGVVANVRVRNAATVGGVLAESDYASDPPAVFLALDAEVDVQGPTGGARSRRRVLRRLLRDGPRAERDRDRRPRPDPAGRAPAPCTRSS